MSRRSKTVLLVEDNDNDAELARLAFARCGVPLELVVAEDGVAAFEYLFDRGEAAAPPDLVLLDLKLPGVDGFEVLRRIRADERLRAVAVVVCTSSAEESDIDRCLRSGANSYLRKPVDFDEFVGVARAIAHYWLVLHQTPAACAAPAPRARGAEADAPEAPS